MRKASDIRRNNLVRLLAQYPSQRDFADLVSTPPSYVSQVINNTRNMGNAVARRIEASLGLPEGWMDVENVRGVEEVSGVAEESASYTVAARYVDIPVYDAEAAMGPGRTVPEHDTVVGNLRLIEHWVCRNLPVSHPQNLAVLSAYGDSMEPTFRDGDILIIDRGITEIRVDAVYVFALRAEMYVKRIQRRPDGSLVIRSDNSLYEPLILSGGELESLRVLGRVLWAWNGRKL